MRISIKDRLASSVEMSTSGGRSASRCGGGCGRRSVWWWLLAFIRWGVIVGCVVFVTHAFALSLDKYLSKKTSVSMTKEEPEMHTYPSVTFCTKFKENKDVAFEILNEEVMREYVEKGDDSSVIEREIDKWAWNLPDFLQVFTHPEGGGPIHAIHMLNNASYWKTSVPHVKESGRCHTYDPPFKSLPGWWYGIRFGLKLPETEEMDLKDKTNRLMDIMVFIHEKDKFTFYSEGDYPNSYRLDMSWLHHEMAAHVAVQYKRVTLLPHEDRPCTDDGDKYFAVCIDEFFSRQRGCQPPWNVHPSVDLPPCRNWSHILQWFHRYELGFDNYERFNYFPIQAVRKTGCPLPCTSSVFAPKFSYEYLSRKDWLGPVDLRSEWVAHLWFENFLFTYESEYVVCNWTCLLGEVGGNFGIFLGASILGLFNLALAQGMSKLAKE